jgi:hypothetical protein
MKLTKLFTFLLGCILLVGPQSCGPGDNQTKNDLPSTPDADQLSPEAVVNLGLVMVNIPSPTLIMASLSESNLKYDPSLINPINKASSYISNYQMAINLGVYGADLGYVSVFNQTQEVLNYFNQVNSMAEKIGVSGVFDKEFFDDINSNLGNPDTLDALISLAFQKMHDNLKTNDRLGTTSITIAGGWIEGLHLALASINETKPKTDLTNRIRNHIYSLKYFIQLLDAFKNSNSNCTAAYNDFQELYKTLKPYIEKPSLEQKELPNIRLEVKKTREKIVA